MSKLAERINDDMRQSILVKTFRDFDRITLPYSLSDDSLVTFYVAGDGGRVEISDRGGVAESLFLSGFNVTNLKMQKSWDAILDEVGFERHLIEDNFEISAVVSEADVPRAIRQLTVAAMRADRLRPRKRGKPTFRERVTASFVNLNLAVVPDDVIPLKGAKPRHVTLSVKTGKRKRYVQALGSAEKSLDYYQARALFADADGLDLDQKVAVLQGGRSNWTDYPLTGLETVAQIEDDTDLPNLARRLTAA